MANGQKESSRTELAANESAVRVDLLTKTLLLVVLCVLVLSVCVNVYLVQQNAALTRAAEMQRQDQQNMMDLYAFMQRLVVDLRGLSARDENVRGLLEKYATTIKGFDLAAQDRGAPRAGGQ